jgi:hypothetical protein
MQVWNLSLWTACGPCAQVLRLKRLLLLAQPESGGSREIRKIFSQPSFEEIFDGHFERDADQVGVHLKPTL